MNNKERTRMFEFHEIANLFPMVSDEQLGELVQDIKENGLREPGYIYEGKILDGRNRAKACELAGVEFQYYDYEDDDPLSFVLSLNLKRRHLDQWDRSALGVKLVPMYAKYGKDKQEEAGKKYGKGHPKLNQKIDEPKPIERQAIGKAAKDAGTNHQYIQDRINLEKEAKKDKTAKAILEAGDNKKLNMPAAKELLKMKPKDRLEVLSSDDPISKAIKSQKAKVSRAERIEKLTDISDNNKELNTNKKYNIIYADPPWQYDHSVSSSREIENQYPTMTLAEICDLPVINIAEKDCTLFIWGTAPKLEECMAVINAWGFSYRTCAVWDKVNIGMGYYWRSQHELLLVATKGSIPSPLPGLRISSIYQEKRGKHSQKPTHYHEIIESWYPELSKIELFCRASRLGWDVWGNQTNEQNS